MKSQRKPAHKINRVLTQSYEAENTVPHLLTLLRSPRANTRLLAASCLTNFKKTNTLLKEYLLDIEKSVLPCIIRLFDADQDDVVERVRFASALLRKFRLIYPRLPWFSQP